MRYKLFAALATPTLLFLIPLSAMAGNWSTDPRNIEESCAKGRIYNARTGKSWLHETSWMMTRSWMKTGVKVPYQVSYDYWKAMADKCPDVK